MRVYLPATLPLLRAAVVAAQCGPAPLAGCAVTAALREWFAEGDAEELDYVALTDAGRAALPLLDVDARAPRRRVVIAVDVPEGWVRAHPDRGRSTVSVAQVVPWSRVVAAYVDDAIAEPAVAAAAESMVAAELGSDDSQFLVDEVDGHELGWYAVQELGPLVELA